MKRQEGFALVELLVAVLILAIGAIAVLGVVDASTRNTFRAEQTQVAINRAQREIEQIRQLDYKDVALTTTPAASSDPEDPRYRVSGSDFALGWDGTTRSNYAEMAVKNIGGLTDGLVEPRAHLVHERRRQRQGLPLRGLAGRPELPEGSEQQHRRLSGNP